MNEATAILTSTPDDAASSHPYERASVLRSPHEAGRRDEGVYGFLTGTWPLGRRGDPGHSGTEALPAPRAASIASARRRKTQSVARGRQV